MHQVCEGCHVFQCEGFVFQCEVLKCACHSEHYNVMFQCEGNCHVFQCEGKCHVFQCLSRPWCCQCPRSTISEWTHPLPPPAPYRFLNSTENVSPVRLSGRSVRCGFSNGVTLRTNSFTLPSKTACPHRRKGKEGGGRKERDGEGRGGKEREGGVNTLRYCF